MLAIQTDALFDGETMHGAAVVLVEHGRIAAIRDAAPAGVAVRRLPAGALLAPGLIDLQVNGGDGVLFNDSPTVDGLRRLAAAHLRDGTTALLPTLISSLPDVLHAALDAAAEAVRQGVPGILGIHVEGPFIAPARRGIHPADAVRPPTDDDLARLCAPFPGARLITLAPEIVPAATIAALARAGWAVFLGHSDATAEAALAGLDAGAVGFTHLYNAMSQLASRAPGMVGAALSQDRATVSIIVDGHHAHMAAIRAAWRALGSRLLCLISDAMPSVGGNAGFMLAGREIFLADGKLTDAAGTLAGAHITLREAVANAVRLAGIPLEQALRMATRTPAECLGLSDRGRIAPGARADFVALGPDLGLAGVWLGGERI